MLSVFLSTKPPAEVLARHLAQFLGVPKVELWDCENEEGPNSETWFWYWDKKGDFVALLEVFGSWPEHFSDADLAAFLSRKYNCKCLIGDDSVNPYSFIEVSGETQRTVYLCDSDDKNKIVLMRHDRA